MELPGLIAAATAVLVTMLTATAADGGNEELPAQAARLATTVGQRLETMLPGGTSTIPATFYARAALEATWAAGDKDPEAVAEARRRADPYVAIPKSRWLEMLPDRSPAPVCDHPSLGGSGYLTTDPFSGAKSGGAWAWFEGLDLVNAPFRMRTTGADGEFIYERVEDYPEGHPYPIAGTDTFPHWDGEARELAYVYSPVVAFDGQPMKVYPANFVWGARLDAIIGNWNGGVLPHLTEAYLATGDEAYAELTIFILERLAAIYPHMPLAYYNGIDPQTRADLVRKAAAHEPVGSHGWLGPSRLTAHHTNFRPPAEGYRAFNLAKAYMAVEHAAAWGDDAAEARKRKDRVRTGLFEELALLFHSYGAYNCVGNGIGMYAPGLVGLGVLLQDSYLYNGFNGILEEFLYNENYYDGISTEGSLNYAGMVGGMFGLWDLRADFDPDCLAEHPFVAICGKSRDRLSSMLGVPSQHGDGPNGAFMATAATPNAPLAPSDAFGGFGITVLRGGDADRRLEIFLHHDRAIGHAHPDMLGMQVHFRGVPIVNFIGDARWGRFLDLHEEKNADAAAIKSLPYPKPMVVEEPTDHRGWSYGLHASPVTKNLVVVDGYAYGIGRAPWRGGELAPLRPYGNLRLFAAGGALQVAEAEAVNLAPLHYQGIRNYRRQLAMITRPDGRAYAIDIFHVDGGNRHLFLWHSPGDPVDSTFADDAGEAGENLEAWLESSTLRDFPVKDDPQDVPRRYEWSPPITRMRHLDQLTDLRAYARPPRSWQHTWRLDYAQWAPKTAAPDTGPPITPEQWHERGVTPVNLRLHGITLPGEYNNYGLRAKSVWPAAITEYVDDQRYWGMVRFRDGLDYVGSFRTSRMRSSANFVHILEPFVESEVPAIARVEALRPAAGDPRLPNGAVGLRVNFADGSTDIFAMLPPGVARYRFGDDLELAGRFALLRLNASGTVTGAQLVAGTEVTWHGEPVLTTSRAEHSGYVAAVEGDLSGDRSHSALIVRPDHSWPAEDLAGRVLTVAFDRGERIQNYTIDRIEPAAGGNLRVVLRGHPPFVDYYGEVAIIGHVSHVPAESLEPNEFIARLACYKGAAFSGSPYLEGARVAFPTLGGLTLTLQSREARAKRWTLAEAVDLQALGIEAGCPFVVFPDFEHAVVRVAAVAAGSDNSLQTER